jgi:enamine deaminase RidA (YjgF/YER057c/UK114 family)
MERRVINPWTWQDQFAFVQANEVSGHQRMLVCAGQTSSAPDGTPIHAGDIAAQITQALDNLQTVLSESGFEMSDVVRLTYYTTDMDGFLGAYGTLAGRLAETNCKPAATLLGVTRLAFPEFMVEIEATAVK